ncbi:MAG TPA: outer membrane protein assembly factor BamC [Burkholderiaceae bacterium]
MSGLQHAIQRPGRLVASRRRGATWLACLLAAALSGCGLFGSKPSSDPGGYGAAATHQGPLEVPPDLAPLSKDDRYALPDQGVSANALRSAGGTSSTTQTVALSSSHARLVRDGAQRWLAVDLPPEKAYQVVKDFWPTQGWKLALDEPTLGIVETDWQEKSEKVDDGVVRHLLNMVLSTVNSTGTRDLYRTRIERTPTDTSEIFITHRGLEEVYTDKDKVATTWQPRARDPELEAEMLQRLLVRFETGEAAPVAKAGDKATTAAAAATALTSVSHVVKDGSESHLEVDEPFDRAWRRVGLALDRGGFTVEDRDRTKGLYFVRYLDPDYQAKQKEARGFFSRVFDSDPKVEAQQFRVALLTDGDRTTVRVQDKDGQPAATSAGDRIIKQLDEQMR